jgi:glutathione-regulated potassium-efflux system ancillary protein KefG
MSEPKETNKILVLFAHPALQKSRVNRKLIGYIDNIEGVTFHDLYEKYHDFHINVTNEQKLLTEHEIIVFHHPIFWFSMPALMKEWMDLVLQHGWAYGKAGRALKGKKLMSVVTTGGRESLYRNEGYNRHTVLEFLAPVSQSARVCGMKYLPPFVVHGTNSIKEDEIVGHGEDYKALLTALRDGRINLEKAMDAQRINQDLYSLIDKEQG